MIIIKNIKIKNFLSYGAKENSIDIYNGINVITGIDKQTQKCNGVGKSSLSESICWGLYGKTIKPLNKSQIINWKNKKNCKVEISFQEVNDVYKIIRGISPNIFKIYKNNEELNETNVKDLQKYLEDEILKINYNTFVSLIYSNPNNFISIFNVPKAKKRNFLENLFNLEVYSDINKKINSKLSENKTNLSTYKTKIEKNLERLKNISKQVNTFQNDLNSIIIDKSNLLSLQNTLANASEASESILEDLKEKYEYYINIQNKINLSISKSSKKYKNFNITLKELNELKKEFSILEYVDNNEISENLLTIKLEIKSLNKQIKDINDSNISSICPLCGSNISKDQISSHINSINEKLKEKNNKVKKLENEINEININNEKYSNKHQEVINVEKKYLETKQYEKWKNVKEKLQKCKEKNDEKLFTIKKELDNINSINIDIIKKEIEFEKKSLKQKILEKKKLEKYILNNTSEISLLQEENTEFNKKIVSLKKMNDYYNFIKILCNDENIKQYAISNLIPILNNKVNYYLSEVGFNFYVKFDGWLECEIKGPGISNATSDNLSGGEKKTLELALQFALYDILKLKAKNIPNILILDELLDTSIDTDGITKLFDLIKIKQKEDNLACFIISHRKEISAFEIDNTYFVEKNNGYSKIWKM